MNSIEAYQGLIFVGKDFSGAENVRNNYEGQVRGGCCFESVIVEIERIEMERIEKVQRKKADNLAIIDPKKLINYPDTSRHPVRPYNRRRQK
jgi:hypothetical protein